METGARHISEILHKCFRITCVSPYRAFVVHSALAIPRLHLKHERGMSGTVKNDSSVGTTRNAHRHRWTAHTQKSGCGRALFAKGLARRPDLVRAKPV